jgi:hypothetical protein
VCLLNDDVFLLACAGGERRGYLRLEKTMMRKVPFVLLGLLVLAAGCSSGLKSQMLGKWEPQEESLKGKGVVVQITASEIKTSGPSGVDVVSPYHFVDGDTIETETSMLGQTFKHKYKVTINGDEMTWTDEKGATKKLKRIK